MCLVTSADRIISQISFGAEILVLLSIVYLLLNSKKINNKYLNMTITKGILGVMLIVILWDVLGLNPIAQCLSE